MKTIPQGMGEYATNMRKILKESHDIMLQAKVSIHATEGSLKHADLDDLQNFCWAINAKLDSGSAIHKLRYAEEVLSRLRRGINKGRDGVLKELAEIKVFHEAGEDFWTVVN